MSLRLLHTLGSEDDDRVWHAAWSRDGRYLATCGEDKIIRIYTSSNGQWGEAV
jgi:WD40 repeat protein